ncbi:MAG: alanine racemase [Gemmatimonadetes bacterium]|nr:alanine racemase [Gemmatimonadota bacterium]
MTYESTAMDTGRAWVDVDLGAVVRNGEALMRHAGVPIVPMVKADAYGVGAAPCARALERLDPVGFGVATVREVEELRAAGISRRIFVFSPLLPLDFPAARAAGAIPTLGDPAAIAAWVNSGGGAWHLAIDSGMQRAGIRWDQIGLVADLVRAHPPEGAFTHFHSAERNDGSWEQQESRFHEALAALPAMPAMLHAQNSAGLVRRGRSPWSFARPGVFLYGVGSGDGAQLLPEPVVHVRARILELHDLQDGDTVSYTASWRAVGRRRVATLGLGYADGYRRSLGNKGPVLINGRRCCVAGVVTMDMTMADVTDIPCGPGDVATLIGRDGGELITVEQVAEVADFMSPYEVLTGLRQRLPRRYHERVS